MRQTQSKARRNMLIGAVVLGGLVVWWAAAPKVDAEETREAPEATSPVHLNIRTVADLFPAGR